MATEFTYESRVTYLDPDSDLKTVTGSYVGPNEILLCVHEDGHYDISEMPDTDANLSQAVEDFGDPAHDDNCVYVKLEKTNAQHIILMDMLCNCAGYTPTWQTEDIHTFTFDDDSTYVMQYRSPVDDNTNHTFDRLKTTVNQDGTINWVRFETWTTPEYELNQIEKILTDYYEKHRVSVSTSARDNLTKLCTIYEHLRDTLIYTVPGHKIDYPGPADLVRGSTY